MLFFLFKGSFENRKFQFSFINLTKNMEKVKEAFDELNRKADLLAEAMLIIPHKPKMMSELNELSKSTKETKEIAEEMKASLEHHEKFIKQEFEKRKTSMNRIQSKMMHLLLAMETVPDASVEQRVEQSNSPVPSTNIARALEFATPDPNSFRPKGVSQLAVPGSTVNSKKKSRIPVFEATITNEKFEKVPAYMKGRNSIIELQHFVNTVLIRAFNEKYKLLQQTKSSLKSPDRALYNEFKVQEPSFGDQNFITADDLLRALDQKNINKKNDRFIQMLRHLGVIRESRKGPTTFYIWMR